MDVVPDSLTVVGRSGRHPSVSLASSASMSTLIIFRAEHMRLPDLVEQAMGRQLTALLGQLEATCAAEQNLATTVKEAFASRSGAGRPLDQIG
ncbi:hypothetical protein NE236_24670 [Actinoallomurus purpureus]|uniref:hypothetical protein n=1 Tax=Actinoallomurus purpureus TaxID=478114 RepID=UPI00209305D7|nr:hypothetical protein [Actinoallomurus purpureus]MCO6008177.1 hypothetical protein [Actinoallomurus purpureus]